MTNRDEMLAAIQRGLARHRGHLERLSNGTSRTPPAFVHPRAEDVVGQFERELALLEVRTHAVESTTGALTALAAVLTREDARSVLAWSDHEIGLEGVEALLASRGIDRRVPDRDRMRFQPDALQALALAEVGITGIDVAIAESGTLVLATGSGRSRLGSLLAPVHVAIVRESQIVRGLGDAMGRLRERYGDTLFRDRSNVTFITGPSRTADIELTLTLGVHGPRSIDVILLR
ncbi:MAG: lactate utilization protein C [Vicinamibacterales bacterium]